MGRPKLPETEKLVPAKTSLPPDLFDAVHRHATRRSMTIADVIRLVVTRAFREPETADSVPSLKL